MLPRADARLPRSPTRPRDARGSRANIGHTMPGQRGRPINPHRQAARERGQKIYHDPDHACRLCGDERRYTSNGTCVYCAIARGNARFANLSPEERERVAARAHERYVARLTNVPDSE